jgi:hypothetical protein
MVAVQDPRGGPVSVDGAPAHFEEQNGYTYLAGIDGSRVITVG